MDVTRSAPSSQGVDARGVLALLDALEADPRIEPHALIIQRHGHRIVEGHWAPHDAGRPRLVYSLSKSFTSAALALQVGEGRLGLDDLVSDHLPELLVDADRLTARMRIRHLASMGTGHDHEMLLDALVADPDDPVRGFFTVPPAKEPGSVFAYSQPPVLALATILGRLAGEPLTDYLRPRLLDPLGIGPFAWTEHRPGVELGFSGVFADLDAIAKLGQLHLDDGVWNGRRILPEGWVAEAGSVQTPNPGEPDPDWSQGYGFGMWMSRHGYRGDGAFGQFMVVLPEHDVVIAMFSATGEMQVVLDLFWTHLLPAFGQVARDGGAADDELAARMAELSMPTAAERRTGEVATVGNGSLAPGPLGPLAHRSLTAIDTVAPSPSERSVGIAGTLRIHEGEDVLEVVVHDHWPEGSDAPVVATAAAGRNGTVMVEVVFRDTPHRLRLRLDEGAGTFAADWSGLPLFGAGIGPRLVEMRAPHR